MIKHIIKVNEVDEFELIFDFVHNSKIRTENINGCTFCDVSIDGQRIVTGTALCGKDDNFDRSFGRKVALKRALEDLSNYYLLSKDERQRIWERYYEKMK